MTNYTIIPKGTIIAGFAGIGKTTAALQYDNVIDLESSHYFFQFMTLTWLITMST